MSCLGVHFALAAEEVEALEAAATDEERLAYLQEEIEDRYFADLPTHLAESDKAWDAMHRALSDGLLTWDGGEFPLNHTVLGGKPLYSGDDYILSLKNPAQVKAVAAALEAIDELVFRQRYEQIDQASYGSNLDDEDFQYTWDWFQGVRALYSRAASEGRYVLFTADQ